MSRGLRRSGARREAAAWSLRLTCDACRFGLFGPVNVWSYLTSPPPIQSELFDTDSESDPAQRQQMPGAFKPPAPQSACAVYVRTRPPARPRCGLCFCVSGGRILSPNVCRVRISRLSAVDVAEWDGPAVLPPLTALRVGGGAPKLLSNDDLLGRVDPVNLEHVLGNIQTDGGNLHVDRSLM